MTHKAPDYSNDLVTTIAKKASEIGKLAGLDAGTTPWLVNFYNLVIQEKYAQIAQSEKTKIMAIKDLENALKRIIELEAMLERQTARIVELQEHIENFDGEDR